MEGKKVDVKFEDNMLKASFDSNKDGQPVVKISLNLNEAVQEILKKGEKVEGAKLADFEFSLTRLIVKIDGDKDGEPVASIEIDLAELLDEAGVMK